MEAESVNSNAISNPADIRPQSCLCLGGLLPLPNYNFGAGGGMSTPMR
jgi:hypothetical protein